jgi:hypothetical protein
VLVAESRDALRERARVLAERAGTPADPDALRESEPAWILGTLDEATVQLETLRDAGVHRVMLQHLVPDDLDTVRLIGRELAPRVR